MTSEQSDVRPEGIFGRILARSRKMLSRHKTAAHDELMSLSTLIENEIIPRLQMTFPTPQSDTPISSGHDNTPEYDTDGFVEALLSPEPDDARTFIDSLIANEHSLKEIYAHLLTPAARRLGAMWEDDLCSFAHVTIAITKIRHIFISTAPLFPLNVVDGDENPPSILLTTVPGEQHTFGLYLVVEIFRDAGWSVWSGTPRSTNELIELVSREHYDVVGLSIVAERNLNIAAAAIADIRSNAANNAIKVLLGGRIAVEKPELVEALDADQVVADTDQIIAHADQLLSKQKHL
ncbi:MAG: B12-binding domain-containing protein [Woeseiaceae bacterium]